MGREPHEAILLRLPPGAAPEDLFDGDLTQEQVTTIGHGGDGAALSLIRMRPGTYTLADFIPAPDGQPHGAHGQVAQFTVERHGPACDRGPR
ncbi:hypothetical protein AB0C04_29250 [Micromonospora sp. NPDC048909]|uniref:hypothetical protein n=1 Tax=Micromonospora sp. NPDC048909 TaxID=3155643 RepID=UPI00340B2BF1